MSTAPVIGVCAAYENAQWGFWNQPAAIVPTTYVNKIRAAGGIPIGLIPDEHVAEDPWLLLQRIDGLLLIGGVDIEPLRYGATRSTITEQTVPERDVFEIALAAQALALDVPVLGICRGLQILNTATGGTLHQHLNEAGFAEHRPAPGRLDGMHEITVEAGTLAAGMAGPGIQSVNSHHHQGVCDVGKGAIVSAQSLPDHLPEALEWPDKRYALGVQWHPEAAELSHALSDFVSAAAAASLEEQR